MDSKFPISDDGNISFYIRFSFVDENINYNTTNLFETRIDFVFQVSYSLYHFVIIVAMELHILFNLDVEI